MPTNLSKVATERGIKYFLISFVDLFGILRSKLVPARAIAGMQKDGAGFAGFAAWLDMTPADSDMFSIPDPDSLIQLPWKPEVGWLAGDLVMDGNAVEASPRVALKQQIARAEIRGFRMKTGVECEYFLVSADGSSISDVNDIQEKPCYDQSALMRQYDVISEICDCMIDLGWGPYQNDHEDANGQFEMNWDYDDALVTADRHVFFKYMVKAIAEKHELRATFMPKPFSNLTGNGCHAHVSVWDKTGQNNLFEDSGDEMGLSKTAYHFLGGILHNAQALTAVFNPTVNSYKRIDGQVTLSGATWSPNAVTYGGNNRTHMVRIPGPGRFELRLMDGAVNPYLLQAGILAAGLDGVESERDPGKRLDVNMYTDGHKIRGLRRLPANLLDAIRLFEKSKVLRSGLGNALVDSYAKLKYQDWRSYSSAISQWEREHTLDC
ncbi:MAG TPA: type III glutamate--ammonia ligase [Gammaproteobacteria bacterium]|jgi:glutamine synthetase|nr:type III glutamate--ammonia ligase [Gammaproteobacteria bacterium]RTZ66146.1 MAG: type III glutamate--ammonia ligase [Gammaproteobacteria bacterium]HAD35981.1 type III glutamate--ammonia ligase [Gammaproteobacteria bacterium]HBK76444.1 type III glutamate--ammonia ligase [Gammaproteobacteria bacterium]HHZ73134.1 type III glutamate--ammonia ligase [Gammaproteobacteria bacterium]